MRHAYETDREFSTGELDADLELESDAELDLRVSGPTFAEGLNRLAQAINHRTLELLRGHLKGENE
jgi:hypothetical protein